MSYGDICLGSFLGSLAYQTVGPWKEAKLLYGSVSFPLSGVNDLPASCSCCERVKEKMQVCTEPCE